ncbi:MAG: hypothetical protein DBP01_12095, partial [gamma proteobacterium symbiont of Ctena orbiculata]
ISNACSVFTGSATGAEALFSGEKYQTTIPAATDTAMISGMRFIRDVSFSFMSFGYTYCPDICPTTMSLFAEMHNRIQAQKSTKPYQVTFVSVDPERDSLERLSEYVTYFDPSFVGATGPEEALQALTKPLGILYRRVETEDSAMGYVMDHSASIILVDPQGRFHAYFSPPHDAEKMANDFIAISSLTTIAR